LGLVLRVGGGEPGGVGVDVSFARDGRVREHVVDGVHVPVRVARVRVRG